MVNRGGVVVNCGRLVLSVLSTIHMPIVIFLMPRFEEVPLQPMGRIVVGVHSGHWVWGGTFTMSVFWRQMNGFVL